MITSLLLVSLLTAQTSNAMHPQHHRRFASGHHNGIRATQSYKLADMYEGQTFFDNFTFFQGADPEGGRVNYLSAADAQSNKLAYVQQDGTVIVKVDDNSTVTQGQNRNSVRLSSKKLYNGGLFIADLFAMPHGCGVTPVWGSRGNDSTKEGQIDLIQAFNNETQNQYSLRTSGKCTIPKIKTSTITEDNDAVGVTSSTNCTASATSKPGCVVQDPRNATYGGSFNRASGGTFAHLWDENGVQVWFFGREDIPCDLLDGTPEPENWGSPVANFKLDGCNAKDALKNQTLTLDTTLCGQSTSGANGCSASCEDLLSNPENFKWAHWAINYIAVYQLS